MHPLDAEDGDPEWSTASISGPPGCCGRCTGSRRPGCTSRGHDYARLAEDVLESYLAGPEFDGPAPSLWIGEGGIALVAWLLSPTRALADRLAELVAADPDGDTLELMWGSPGLLLIADAMLERTGRSAGGRVERDRRHLMGQWGARVPDFWTQRLYGQQEILGPAHGLAGVVAALARRPELLPPGRLVPRTAAALSATAIREGEQANWPPASAGRSRTRAARSAPSGATALPASWRRSPRCRATTSSTRCCSRAAS